MVVVPDAGPADEGPLDFGPGGGPDLSGPLDFGSLDTGAPDVGVATAPRAAPTALNFGPVRLFSPKVVTTEVSTDVDRTLRLRIEPPDPDVTLIATEITLGADESVSVPVVFRPTEARNLSAQLVIESCGGACPVRVALTGTGRAPGIRCDDIDVGVIPAGTCVETELPCTNLVAQEPVFLGGTLSGMGGGLLSDTFVVPAQQDFEVNVEVCAPEVGTFEYVLSTDYRFPGNFDETERTTIRVEGANGMPLTCRLEISSSLDFGTVNLMQIQGGSVELSNRGTAVCNVGTPVLTGPHLQDFSVPGARSFSLDPGRSTNVAVQFSPSQSGLRQAALTFPSNDPVQPNATAALRGVGQSMTVTGFRVQTTSGIPSLPTGRGLTFTNLDDGFAREPLPFSFSFLGTSVSEVFISSNGFVSFSQSGAGSLTNRTMPSANNPNQLVAWFWDDLILDLPGSQVTVALQGTAPNRRQVFTFRRIRRFGGGGVANGDTELNLQVELHETTNEIVVHYGSTSSLTAASNFDASVGWENAGGTRGADPLMCSPTCALSTWPTNTKYRYIPN